MLCQRSTRPVVAACVGAVVFGALPLGDDVARAGGPVSSLRPFLGPVFPQKQHQVAPDPTDVAVGDFNVDGYPDVVTGHVLNAGVLTFLLTNRDGDFPTSHSRPVSGSGAIIAADFDGDGRDDLARLTSAGFTVFRNITAPGAEMPAFADQIFSAGVTPGELALGDFDGDARLDVLINSTPSGPGLSVLRNVSEPGSAAFDAPLYFGLDLGAGRSMAVGDVNADGRPDVAVTVPGSRSVSMLENWTTPGGVITFAPRRGWYPAVDFVPYSVAIGDFDLDGRGDLAMTNGTRLGLMLNNTPWWSAYTTFADFVSLGNLASGLEITLDALDVDADGRTDVVATGGGQGIELLRNTAGAGLTSFEVSRRFGTAADWCRRAVADLDGDLRADLVLVYPGRDIVTTHRNLSSAGGGPVFESRTSVQLGISYNNTLLAADLNGNGADEMIVADFGPLEVYRSTGEPPAPGVPLELTRCFSGPGNSFGLTVADIDGDGGNDLITAGVRVARNLTPQGAAMLTFAEPVTIPSSVTGTMAGACDLDGDGRPEVVSIGSEAASPSTQKMVVHRNTSEPGSVSLVEEIATPTLAAPIALNLADFDSDARRDILVLHRGSIDPSKFSVFRNTSTPGSIALAPRADLDSGTWIDRADVADFDNDGRPDFATGGSFLATVSVFRNETVAGSTEIVFAPKFDVPVGTKFGALTAADVDMDGWVDLMIATTNAGGVGRGFSVAIMYNVTAAPGAPLAFLPPQHHSSLNSGGRIVAGDFDGNGTPDLATGSNSLVDVFRNQTPAPACFADFNRDGAVTTGDLTFFISRFGQLADPNSLAQRADFNDDGVVNTPDLAFFLGRFGEACR